MQGTFNLVGRVNPLSQPRPASHPPRGLTGSSPPLAYIFWMSRLYSICIIPPTSHRILSIPLYPCVYLHLAILQEIHCIPLYLNVSSCIRSYPAVSSCIPQSRCTCMSPSHRIPHRLENGIWPKIHSARGGLGAACAASGVWHAKGRTSHALCLAGSPMAIIGVA